MTWRFTHILACLFLAVFVHSSHMANAQVAVNNTIDPSDTELNAAVRFLQQYLSEFTPGRQYLPDFTRYWPEEDCQRYRIPDKLIYAVNSEIPTYMLGRARILYAKPEGSLVHAKVMFSSVDSNENVLVTSITNHYMKRQADGAFRFVSPTQLHDNEWRITEFQSIEYHYPAYHKFDKVKAKALADKIETLEKEWQLRPIYIRYYFADTKEEIERYRGFDFTIAMGNRDKPSGISDGIDNMVWCGGLGEDYFHEVVHLYLNPLYPRSPLIEGLAVFYGGSLGHDLQWHLKRLNTYLKEHPEIDLDKIDDFYYMDNYTNPLSTIQGLMCLMAYKKDSIAGLKRTMNYITFSSLLKKEYGVDSKGWNTFLRDKIGEYGR